jgi:hypothetical protein
MARRSSPAWQFFGDEGTLARCKHCDTAIALDADRSTSSMLKHLSHVHKINVGLLGEVRVASGPLDSFMKAPRIISPTTWVAFLALDSRPLSVVDGEGFRMFVKELGGSIPSRRTVARNVLSVFAEFHSWVRSYWPKFS